MNDFHFTLIRELDKCKFAPATYEKAFVRDAQQWKRDKELTPNQQNYLEKVAWRYRKQLATKGYQVEGYIDPDILKDNINAVHEIAKEYQAKRKRQKNMKFGPTVCERCGDSIVTIDSGHGNLVNIESSTYHAGDRVFDQERHKRHRDVCEARHRKKRQLAYNE